MNPFSLIFSLFFGLLGSGFLLYGKTTSQLLPIASGLGLMVCPCFISSIPLMLALCIPLAAAPFMIRI